MKQNTFIILLCFAILSCNAQKNFSSTNNQTRLTQSNSPKLVVGIVVDQMRYDYLTRFDSKFGEGGFKRMMREGFNCKNNHFNYVPTYTGPGHASVFTGTTPKYHGVISNNWYSKTEKKVVYCAGDENVKSIGTESDAGKMSPHRMLTTSFADENKLFTQMRGKTIGIAIKDRGAILPAGHTADAAYWFYGKDEGHFITSSFYRNDLPKWVNQFNDSDTAESYFKVWDTHYDIKSYTESGSDDNNFEGGFKGKEKATFPYDLAKLKDKNGGFDILKATAYGNSLTTEFAIASVKGEALGKDSTTDILTLSYSSTDYVGHNFGVNSKEVEDTYVRLDKDLERFFEFLDTEVGVGEYTVFLTADHGATDVPGFLKEKKIPINYFNSKKFNYHIEKSLIKLFGNKYLISSNSNQQIFLNHELIKKLNISPKVVKQSIIDVIQSFPGIDNVYSSEQIFSEIDDHFIKLIRNGFNKNLSGDIVYTMMPNWVYYRKGSTHGRRFNQHTHVPLILFGDGIKRGSISRETDVIDIAPTIASVLGISSPNATTGKVIFEAIDD